jgi:plastocyanin
MVFHNNDLYFGSYNEGSIHKLVLSSDGNKVVSDTIVYQGKPFGIVGVFTNPDREFFIATTNKISKIKLVKGKGNNMKKNMMMWIIAVVVILALAIGGIVIYSNNLKNTNNTTNTQSTTPGTVTVQNFSFNPTTITVNKGDTVTWQNNDSVTHHVVADDGSFDLGDMPGGSTSKHTFDKAGTYNYHCAIHTEMKGTVIVK